MLYNDIIDGDQFHASEVHDAGPALEGVRYVTVDYEAAAQRHIDDINNNIANEAAYQRRKEIDARLAELDTEGD